MDVAIGIDSHKATLEVAALDGLGRPLQGRRFHNDTAGHGALLRWITEFDGRRVVGIECSGTFGAALARCLVAAGEDVREVPGNLSFAEANLRSKGKSDHTDAVAIARVVLRESSLPAVKDGTNEGLKLLSDHRDRLIKARTKELSRIHAFMVILRPGYHSSLGILKQDKGLTTVTKMLRGDHCVRADLVREGVAEVRRLNRCVKRVEDQIAELLEESGTTLHAGVGIGAMLAARILGEVGDPARLRSAAGFARMSGVAPIPASSGSVVRHRHDRRGNRTLNRAIHMVAVVRCRLDPATKEYMAKKRAEGKTGKEAMRCLKRHIATDIYRRMQADCLSDFGQVLTI
jgi:transposase